MKIAELLNSKVQYEVLLDTSDEFETQATIGNRVIKFEANRQNDDEWDIEFQEYSEQHPGGTYGKTGAGGELEVFAMIKASIEQLIKTHGATDLHFTASKQFDDKRAVVYDKLVKRFLPKNWEFTKTDKDLGGINFSEFHMRKV